MSDNPLLDTSGLPRFDLIRPEHVLPAVERVLADNRAMLDTLLADPHAATFESLVIPLERMGHRLGRVWSPASHLNAVANDPALREAYNACLPLLSAWATELGQNETLFRAMQRVAERDDGRDPVRSKLLANALRDFRLAGVDLPPARKQRYAALMQELATLGATFEQNLLDCADAWQHHVTADAAVSGLPASLLARTAKAAREKDLDGWLFSLDPPTYMAVLSHADDAGLRETFYRAWVTRASDRGPHDPRWNNASTMQRILDARHETAQLLGFDNYAEYSLARKMADSPQHVVGFLEQMAERSRPVAEREMAELEALAGRALDAWDVPYYVEKLRLQRFDLSDEALRPYFPAPKVIGGLLRLAQSLFGITLVEHEDVITWHPDVRYFEVRDADGSALGGVFTDLYARSGKRGGAWMDECVVRQAMDEEINHPVAYLVCNFPPPGEDSPSLLNHQEVVTLFHEFGHTLHHLLTRVDYPSLSGINGVPWDAVELPSQFLENYAWAPEVMPWISAHHETGQPLPDEWLQRLRASRVFQAGMQTVRQLEFALFDFRLHAGHDPAVGARIEETLAEVRRDVAVVRVPEWNRFANGFSHIFGGGYAAGYYSYKWAEVLAADAFGAFEERGVLDRTTAQRFHDSILAVGGSRDAMQAFVDFRGREPDVQALLRQYGMAA